jgi:hypothetical protein
LPKQTERERLFWRTLPTLADVYDELPSPKTVTKTRDDNGREVWESVVRNTYGKLVFSFHPQRAEETYYDYFVRLVSGIADDAPINESVVEAVHARYPGIIPKQVTYAKEILESVLPSVIERAIVLSGQLAIDRAIWDLHKVTHTLTTEVRAAQGMDCLMRTVSQMISPHIKHARGPKEGSQQVNLKTSKAKLEADINTAIRELLDAELRPSRGAVSRMLQKRGYSKLTNPKALDRLRSQCHDGRSWIQVVADAGGRNEAFTR